VRYKIPLREARGAFEQRRAFDSNDTLRGYRGAPREYGWLTNVWANFIRQFRDEIVYTVMSYYTPVAWVMRDGRVIVPPIRHSVTTQRHIRALGVRYSPEVVVDYDEAVAA
jgi:hypothetical protein